MSKSAFEEFDKKYNAELLQKEIEEASTNEGGGGREVPPGTYEIKFTKLELGLSKTSKQPMVKAYMKVLTGEYSGSVIFMNQVVTQGFQLHIANEFLRSLVPDMGIEFNGFVEYEKLINEVFEAIDGRCEYALEYGRNEKDYPTYAITERFSVGDDVPF